MNKNNSDDKTSRVGLWNDFYKEDTTVQMYHDHSTAKVAGGFLNVPNITTIQDWGCGFGGFKKYIGDHQTYVGIDGSTTESATEIVDLEKYTSSVDGIHMRGVLAHNLGWLNILKNALLSFQKRMVLTLFTPYQNETTVLQRYANFNNTGKEVVDIGFLRDDIVKNFSDLSWHAIENIKTDTQYGIEHMFFLEKIKT